MVELDSKHAKYFTLNPISRKLVNNFFEQILELYLRVDPTKILDVGCGEGFILHTLNKARPIKEAYAIDYNEAEVNDAQRNLPFCDVRLANIYNIPYPDKTFDLVICSEVLEHLEDAKKGLTELYRVCSDQAIISVPNEPIWRLLNMARLKYWNRLGNTPDHLNHWSTKSFIRFVNYYFEILEIRKPLPWTILLCKKKNGLIL